MARKVVLELRELGVNELELKVDEFRRELFGLRLSSATSHVKDCSQYKKLRKNIARGLTLLQEKKQQAPTQEPVAEKNS